MEITHQLARAAVLASPEIGPATGLELYQVVKSAAYALECEAAVFYASSDNVFRVGASFGIEMPVVAAGSQILSDAACLRPDHILIVNDITSQPGYTATDAQISGDGMPLVRFLVAARVTNGDDAMLGILVVADGLPHAGLSAAKIYVLRAHAAQIAALLELQILRDAPDQKPSAAACTLGTERLRLLESVVVSANDAVLITSAEPIDLPGPRIVYCNAAFTRTTGYSEAEILGRTPRLLQAKGTNRQALDRLRKALTLWKPVEVELLNRRKDGTEFWVELSIVPVANEKGWFTHWVSVQRDVSERKTAEKTATRALVVEAENRLLEAEIQERKRVEAQLLYTAFHDDLTKLRNRAFFMDQVAVALDRVKRDASFRCSVLFLDLDRFKLVNDSLGHRAGDLLLMEVAQRLRTCVRPQDTLARVGGDEFALLIEDLDEVTSAVSLPKKIIEIMRLPIWLGHQEIFSSCSIGVAQATLDHLLPEELLRDADIAMYQAKRQETGNYVVFASSMHSGAVAALELHTDLQNAVARGEFFLHYQPICNPRTKQITGLEALIRWNHPLRGLVPPITFIAGAEETGLIRGIGQWVMREACIQMRAWLDRFPGLPLRLSVNASAEELRADDFVLTVKQTLAETQLDPRNLQIEITESIFLQKPERIEQILGSIRSLGIRIALDDFGTGYSSLSYLDRFQIDTLKIDQSFVIRMLERNKTMAIVESIVRLGHALSLDIVAEGVEDQTQMDALISIDCGFVQGYFLGRPMSSEDVTTILARQYHQIMAAQ